MQCNRKKVCILYTGGTIGMIPSENGYVPAEGKLKQVLDGVQAMHHPDLPEWDLIEFSPLLDSSDIAVKEWNEMGRTIARLYQGYDGFVVLHGTDTMAYSASALSFMLENLNKPVIFTGSQIPISQLRSDGIDNIVNSVVIAASDKVHEVCLYFDGKLLRGNRTTKMSSDQFGAFESPNAPPLAEAGINIRYNTGIIIRPDDWNTRPTFHKTLDTRVAILKIHPGITPQVARGILCAPESKAVIIETYGAGNAPSKGWFLDMVTEATKMGKILLNVTQCLAGSVNMDIYATGKCLKNAGVCNGYDCTTEGALAKLYYLMGWSENNSLVKEMLERDLRGEISK